MAVFMPAFPARARTQPAECTVIFRVYFTQGTSVKPSETRERPLPRTALTR